jgi:hypothetical protein
MPLAVHVWTAPMDARLRRMRAEGASWMATAAALGIGPEAAIERGRRIAASPPPVSASPPTEDPDREPLPAGHPRAWTVLTDGTWLAGTAYPWPVQVGVLA